MGMAMPPGSVALLHELDDDALARAAADRRYPKWSTMCLLRQLGYPVLNACCIHPSYAALLHAAVRRLSIAASTDRLLLRSDGGVEATQYYRGGNTFPLHQLEPRAAALLHAGQAVILTEPTNRFTNRLSAVIRIDCDHRYARGSFILEALGPGYDVSDLNRGGIQPQLTVAVYDIDWARYRELWWSDLHVTVRTSAGAEQRRRHQRLLRLATDILPDIGQAPPTGEPATAKAWLEAHGYLSLWRPWDPMAVIRGIRRWDDDGFILANALQSREWRCLSLPLSTLGHGRTVYWDVVDGQHKHGTTPPPHQPAAARQLAGAGR
jgi:hypothetical protein